MINLGKANYVSATSTAGAVEQPKRSILPLSIDEVARFWSSFRTTCDLAIVGLMLLQGLRSAEVLGLNPDDVLLSEGQLRVRGKGGKLRFLPPGSRNRSTA